MTTYAVICLNKEQFEDEFLPQFESKGKYYKRDGYFIHDDHTKPQVKYVCVPTGESDFIRGMQFDGVIIHKAVNESKHGNWYCATIKPALKWGKYEG